MKPIFTREAGDVETSVLLYLSTFSHVGCGGKPVAYVAQGLGCSGCNSKWSAEGPLGAAIERTKEFRSLIL